MTAKTLLRWSLKRGIYQTRFLEQTSWLSSANVKHPAHPQRTKPLGSGRGRNISKEGPSAGLCCHVKKQGYDTDNITYLQTVSPMKYIYILQICFAKNVFSIFTSWITFTGNIFPRYRKRDIPLQQRNRREEEKGNIIQVYNIILVKYLY